ncbi:MAG: hypothetical protein ACYSOW_02490, partial [Planctomycetota bacterium]
KNYFRPSQTNSWIRPGHLFIPYLRKRPYYSLSRYITIHKRKQNPILQSFNRIKTTILSTLQNLRPNYPAPSGRTIKIGTPDPGRCPGLNYTAPLVQTAPLGTRASRPQIKTDATGTVAFPSPGLKGQSTLAGVHGLDSRTPTSKIRPERAAYTPREINQSDQTKKTQNKPISQGTHNGVSRLSKNDYCSLMTDNCSKNKPKQSQLTRSVTPGRACPGPDPGIRGPDYDRDGLAPGASGHIARSITVAALFLPLHCNPDKLLAGMVSGDIIPINTIV